MRKSVFTAVQVCIVKCVLLTQLFLNVGKISTSSKCRSSMPGKDGLYCYAEINAGTAVCLVVCHCLLSCLVVDVVITVKEPLLEYISSYICAPVVDKSQRYVLKVMFKWRVCVSPGSECKVPAGVLTVSLELYPPLTEPLNADVISTQVSTLGSRHPLFIHGE